MPEDLIWTKDEIVELIYEQLEEVAIRNLIDQLTNELPENRETQKDRNSKDEIDGDIEFLKGILKDAKSGDIDYVKIQCKDWIDELEKLKDSKTIRFITVESSNGKLKVSKPDALITVESSNGILKVSKNDGSVHEVELYEEGDPSIKNITGFDLAEWLSHYEKDEVPDTIDILDLGYWTVDGEHTPPAQDWREEFRKK